MVCTLTSDFGVLSSTGETITSLDVFADNCATGSSTLALAGFVVELFDVVGKGVVAFAALSVAVRFKKIPVMWSTGQ